MNDPHRVSAIVAAAQALPTDEDRQAYLRDACAGDEALRQEVIAAMGEADHEAASSEAAAGPWQESNSSSEPNCCGLGQLDDAERANSEALPEAPVTAGSTRSGMVPFALVVVVLVMLASIALNVFLAMHAARLANELDAAVLVAEGAAASLRREQASRREVEEQAQSADTALHESQAQAKKLAKQAEAAERASEEHAIQARAAQLESTRNRTAMNAALTIGEKLLNHTVTTPTIRDGRATFLKQLDELDQRFEQEFAGQPEARARLQFALAKVQVSSGQYRQAEALLEKCSQSRRTSLGADHPLTLAADAELGIIRVYGGKHDEGRKLLEATWAAHKAKLGPSHIDTIDTGLKLGEAYRHLDWARHARTLLEELLAVAEKVLGADHELTEAAKNNLALIHSGEGRFELAVQMFESLLKCEREKLGGDHPRMLTTENNLALAYWAAGDLVKARDIWERVAATQEAKLGQDHPGAFWTRHNAAIVTSCLLENEWAAQLFASLVDARERTHGRNHPATNSARNAMAMNQAWKKISARYHVALYKHGAEHPDVLQARVDFAVAILNDRPPGAVYHLSEVLPILRKKVGGDDPSTLRCQVRLGQARAAQRRFDLAEPFLRDVVERLEKRGDERQVIYLEALKSLANACEQLKKDADANQLRKKIRKLEPGS